MQNTIIDRMLITGDLHGDTSALTLIAKENARERLSVCCWRFWVYFQR